MMFVLVLAVSLTLCFRGFAPYEIAPKMPNMEDCDRDLTIKHQEILYSKYRGLWDYRSRIPSNDSEDEYFHRTGSVMFVNWQDENIVINCPCIGESKAHIRWEMYLDQDAPRFNRRNYTGRELYIASPHPGGYYRTFVCMNSTARHYFNVFTRPGPETDFQISATENSHNVSWRCFMASDRANSRNRAQGPYTFAWVFPNKKIFRQPGDIDANIHFSVHSPKEEMKIFSGTIETEGWSMLSIKGPNGTIINRHSGLYECIVTDRNGLSSSFRFDRLDETQPTYRDSLRSNREFEGYVHVNIRPKYWYLVPIVISAFMGIWSLVFGMYFADDGPLVFQHGHGGNRWEIGAGDLPYIPLMPQLQMPQTRGAGDAAVVFGLGPNHPDIDNAF